MTENKKETVQEVIETVESNDKTVDEISEDLEFEANDRFVVSPHLRILISFIVLLFGFAIGFTVGWLAF